MGIMDDDLTATMPDGHPLGASAPTDCETLFREEGDHAWVSLGEERVCEGLWGLLRRRQDEPSYRDDVREALAPGHRYLIGREIGRGGMGVVFEGWDAQLQRSVAIKLMDRKQEARPVGLLWFFREARLASQLRHPGIVAIHEFDLTDQGQPFIVMQLLTGQTLKHILSLRHDAVAELPGLLATFLQVCQAVASAHGAGVIHRDLKPSNIMVGQFGVVTVMDWGMAQVLGSGSDDAVAPTEDELPRIPAKTAGETEIHRTVAGTVCGTPAYLAPEQARGEIARVDRRSDVFGLGAILCEILSGSPPFSAATSDASWAKAAAGDVADAFARLDACDGPLPLVSLAKKCLAADPAARPDDAAAIVAGLTDYLESGQRRAEQELVRFFDLSLDLFCIAGLNGFFRQINENFPRLLGYSIDELKSRQFMDFVHPDDREKTTTEIARLARGESTIQFVNRYRHADGSYIWLEWNARSEPDEAAIYAVARDVTDRVTAAETYRRLQTSLEKSRQELVDFTENANVALHWVDADGRIVWANQAELDFLGYTREEYLGSPVARYHADTDTIADILARLDRRECLVGREARLVAKDGAIKYVAIYSSASVEDGRFDHSRCFTIDISHQKQIEALAQERATLAAFTAAAGLFLTAGGGLRKRLEDVAAEAVSHLDLTAVEVWGRSQHDDGLMLLARAGVSIAPAEESVEESVGIVIGQGPIGLIARTQQPRHLHDSHADWQEFDTACLARHGIRSFVGYPLLVADQLVGVLAVYAASPVSDVLITALSSVVASMALAIRLEGSPLSTPGSSTPGRT
jgi:eukaryotic-like serine/threonine-protein kinase